MASEVQWFVFLPDKQLTWVQSLGYTDCHCKSLWEKVTAKHQSITVVAFLGHLLSLIAQCLTYAAVIVEYSCQQKQHLYFPYIHAHFNANCCLGFARGHSGMEQAVLELQ